MSLFTLENQIKTKISSFSSNYTKIGVLVDNNTYKHCYPLIENSLHNHYVIEIEEGEDKKTLDTCTIIWKKFTEQYFDRDSLLINLGGGLICDLGGLCASLYKRGIDFINVPTTLLSQVDASIGGKVGINFSSYKNHIGLYNEPVISIINPSFLKTLDTRQLISGYAEIIKYSLIANKKLWNEIKNKSCWKDTITEDIIKKSILCKIEIVKEDPKDNNMRKSLNFGHTIGHGIESCFLSREKKILHGEAIAIGMICETFLSHKKLNLNRETMRMIINYIMKIYKKQDIPRSIFNSICEKIAHDKKNL